MCSSSSSGSSGGSSGSSGSSGSGELCIYDAIVSKRFYYKRTQNVCIDTPYSVKRAGKRIHDTHARIHHHAERERKREREREKPKECAPRLIFEPLNTVTLSFSCF